MNKYLKKFLCKYFLDDNKSVKLGSLIEHSIRYLILLITIIVVIVIMYCSIFTIKLFLGDKNISEDIVLVGVWGLTIEVIIFCYIIFYYIPIKIYDRIKDIEITKCDK